jgi:gamma-glutamyl:cysteine ligase YbdK (ATP-grasp superfamily)
VTKRPVLHLLQGLGIEIEYMIVRKDTLDVLPVSDEVLRSAGGTYANDYESGAMGWSNEFVLHVMELKNTEPVPSLKGLVREFHGEIKLINKILDPLGGLLMPSGMHPWMNPRTETKLWPHRYRKIYGTYDRIFNCRRHGWANLQSIHVNLSFHGDEEFAKLHAAVRLLLPIIPALAASSPVAGGKISDFHDTRLSYYRNNQRKVPSVMGRIIPEPVYTEAAYRQSILKTMYRDIAAYDPEGTIQHEWLNSRGAIARFERNAIEIRVIDTQECPAANIAVSELIVGVIQLLVSGQWTPVEDQKKWPVSPLVSIFRDTIRGGETVLIENARYLKMLGFPGSKAEAGELWGHLAEEAGRRRLLNDKSRKIIRFILDQGTLSSRILKTLGGDDSHARLKDVYGKLCRCLARNEMFTG